MFAIANTKVRFIHSNKLGAKQNMSIDESLVKSFQKNDLPIFRLYSWERSFTIGISQDFDNYEELKNKIPNFSKRLTGGGVLFHGDDISYSLVFPSSLFKGIGVKQSYEEICKFLFNFYKSLDMDIGYAKDINELQLFKSEFCQVGFEPYDIIHKGEKLGGNAQRRTKDVIFQHGSIPVDKLDKKISIKQIESKLIDSFKDTFLVSLGESDLNEKEKNIMHTILKDKYDNEK